MVAPYLLLIFKTLIIIPETYLEAKHKELKATVTSNLESDEDSRTRKFRKRKRKNSSSSSEDRSPRRKTTKTSRGKKLIQSKPPPRSLFKELTAPVHPLNSVGLETGTYYYC